MFCENGEYPDERSATGRGGTRRAGSLATKQPVIEGASIKAPVAARCRRAGGPRDIRMAQSESMLKQLIDYGNRHLPRTGRCPIVYLNIGFIRWSYELLLGVGFVSLKMNCDNVETVSDIIKTDTNLDMLLDMLKCWEDRDRGAADRHAHTPNNNSRYCCTVK